ncbi:hypothetical protein BO94DRAFT_312292 [Aspergillus sclerotioniger CBS 115572]|uniref:Uncharacterized protein n=1 Tax=Aspergillus sclerotioniger CBS 115572 TaxID=1450535 RepID=A0A317X5P5_9EURO|nr:hypothetical protein BO94DRAFT_312292 [Aspergillus sclerotioniger CBS 115572]PWY93889.1 hypothetical protein BO94DRAFT_312292 [Aspergillus sclerotioniger CBS 115572]
MRVHLSKGCGLFLRRPREAPGLGRFEPGSSSPKLMCGLEGVKDVKPSWPQAKYGLDQGVARYRWVDGFPVPRPKGNEKHGHRPGVNTSCPKFYSNPQHWPVGAPSYQHYNDLWRLRSRVMVSHMDERISELSFCSQRCLFIVYARVDSRQAKHDRCHSAPEEGVEDGMSVSLD